MRISAKKAGHQNSNAQTRRDEVRGKIRLLWLMPKLRHLNGKPTTIESKNTHIQPASTQSYSTDSCDRFVINEIKHDTSSFDSKRRINDKSEIHWKLSQKVLPKPSDSNKDKSSIFFHDNFQNSRRLATHTRVKSIPSEIIIEDECSSLCDSTIGPFNKEDPILSNHAYDFMLLDKDYDSWIKSRDFEDDEKVFVIKSEKGRKGCAGLKNIFLNGNKKRDRKTDRNRVIQWFLRKKSKMVDVTGNIPEKCFESNSLSKEILSDVNKINGESKQRFIGYQNVAVEEYLPIQTLTLNSEKKASSACVKSNMNRKYDGEARKRKILDSEISAITDRASSLGDIDDFSLEQSKYDVGTCVTRVSF
eukprot:CAMPEP_0184868876 /NCGR_PEP_ID=MMETSP0580-20130426/32016_1 /TAXON_ID=1118495 /ORGANISM="Dactyliosolen fragilissimus" /LENGTH=360 /DNA_ID=CAMNT_0027370033 /DNA_START=65 /DNA_END=1147 /DNA_ORIENTATION=-